MADFILIMLGAVVLLALEAVFKLRRRGRAVLIGLSLAVTISNAVWSIHVDPSHLFSQLLGDLTGFLSVVIAWLLLSTWIRGTPIRQNENVVHK
ncbi:MAG: hypothetical protein ROO76_13120 [Terriglobia bacterium]|nr:hypothetical protein [Terriglobia bacterium]